MKRKILFFSLMLTFLFASCSNLIDELTVTKEKEANYTVTISDKIENGTVTASPTTAAAGTEITLTAEPASLQPQAQNLMMDLRLKASHK